MSNIPNLYNENDLMAIRINDTLKSVLDPELGINIIDMGLVYSIRFNKIEGIMIEMTLSSKGCPMGDAIMSDIKSLLDTHFPEHKNIVNLVWEPRWSPQLITPAGRELLNSY